MTKVKKKVTMMIMGEHEPQRFDADEFFYSHDERAFQVKYSNPVGDAVRSFPRENVAWVEIKVLPME